MTRLEFYQKYGHHKVTFSSYYKYTFNFSCLLEDGSTLSVQCGGNHEEIYRYEVSANDPVTMNDLKPYSGGVYKDGITIEGFYDY